MAKILLAHPLFLAKSSDEQRAASPYFPLGLLYLAAYVRERGHEVAIFDGTFEADESAFVEALTEHLPDVVGISMLQPTRAEALTLAELAHGFGTVVIVGGPEATRSPGTYAADPAVDVVVHHEGEQTIGRLLDLFDEDGLAEGIDEELGIAFATPTGVQVNAPRPPIADLDTLPLPARDLIDMDRYREQWESEVGYSSITIATSRGCPYGCEWCIDSVHGVDYRQRSPESVAAEVELLKATYDPGRLRMVDDVDGIDRSWFDAWVEAGADVPFESLNGIARRDLPLLDIADTL